MRAKSLKSHILPETKLFVKVSFFENQVISQSNDLLLERELVNAFEDDHA